MYCLGIGSMRLNIFKGVEVGKLELDWIVKDNIVWIKDCPLPEGETLMKYKAP